MKPFRISLVIPAHNEEAYIETCLQHAIRHAGDHFHEIIVVNNASTDDTHEKVKAFPDVRVAFETNKGLTYARQRGFNEATGDLLAYIDADTRMPSKWIQTVMEEFEKDPALVCLSGPYVYYDFPITYKLGTWLYWRLLAWPISRVTGYMAVGGNFVIRRDVVEKMSGFDTSISFYGEDTDIARRASKFGKVKFTTRLVMPTSARRLNKQGVFRTGWTYIKNFLSIVFRHRPATNVYQDIR